MLVTLWWQFEDFGGRNIGGFHGVELDRNSVHLKTIFTFVYLHFEMHANVTTNNRINLNVEGEVGAWMFQLKITFLYDTNCSESWTWISVQNLTLATLFNAMGFDKDQAPTNSCSQLFALLVVFAVRWTLTKKNHLFNPFFTYYFEFISRYIWKQHGNKFILLFPSNDWKCLLTL